MPTGTSTEATGLVEPLLGVCTVLVATARGAGAVAGFPRIDSRFYAETIAFCAVRATGRTTLGKEVGRSRSPAYPGGSLQVRAIVPPKPGIEAHRGFKKHQRRGAPTGDRLFLEQAPFSVGTGDHIPLMDEAREIKVAYN